MTNRLLNLATVLFVLLSLGAAIMRVRSGWVTDSWELPPRPAPHFNVATQTGWVSHRHLESTDGRVAWISYDVMEKRFVPPPLHQTPDLPLAPGQQGRDDVRVRNYLPPGTIHGRVPFVEWYLPPRRGRYIAVDWRVPTLAFALPPLARWLWSRRRVRARAGPAFPVVPLEK